MTQETDKKQTTGRPAAKTTTQSRSREYSRTRKYDERWGQTERKPYARRDDRKPYGRRDDRRDGKQTERSPRTYDRTERAQYKAQRDLTPYVQPEPTGFTPFNLKWELQKAIDKLGYTDPTPIQQQVRDAAVEGKNVVGQSQTGTGKTTAFLLPLLQKIDNKNRYPQVLIVAPTRELVMQIREDIMKLTEFLPMRSMVLIGGKSIHFQKEDLAFWPQFIVATPGRLIEFMQNRFFDASKIEYFVLDEVDRMLDMWFIEDVDWIWTQLDNLKQTMTFSATLAQEIKNVIKKHCPEYVDIRVGEKVTVDKIDHTYIEVPHEHKFATLVEILRAHQWQKTLIFSQTKRNTETLTKHLQQEKLDGEKINVHFLNGDLDMRHRTRTLRAFKDGSCNILVTTDVAARWLNMDNVQLVINFDVPREPESYVHRIGRTGRAGADGKAIMMVDKDERHLILGIEKEHKIKLQKSSTIKSVLDKADEYFDVNLDRPLPPSEKKRRMVARSIAASYRQDRGWYKAGWFRGDRGSRSGERSGRNFGEKKSFGRDSVREGWFERRKDNEKTTEKRTYTDRNTTWKRESSRFAERPYERKERRESRSSRSQFDNKSERYNRKTDRNTTKRASSIGWYDVAFFNEQRKQEQAKFVKRTPKANDRKESMARWWEKRTKSRLSTRR